MRKLFVFISLILSLGVLAQESKTKPDVDMDKFITELMGKMTLEEKIGQLHQISGGDVVSGELSSGIRWPSKYVKEV